MIVTLQPWLCEHALNATVYVHCLSCYLWWVYIFWVIWTLHKKNDGMKAYDFDAVAHFQAVDSLLAL